MYRTVAVIAILAATFVFTAVKSSCAQSSDEPGWYIESEISGVWVGGNSVTRTVGLRALTSYNWPKSVLSIQGGGLRTESTLKTRSAVGTPDEFEILETKTSATTSEAYNMQSSYEYRFSPKSFAMGGVDWLRNTFSGVDSRFLVGFGAGSTWIDDQHTKLETIYGFTYTFQSDVVQNPFNAGKYPGVRISYNLKTKVSSTTRLQSRFAGDWNLDNTTDVRVDWTNSVTVSIVSILALKPSVRILWSNDPPLTKVPLETTEAVETTDFVFVPLKKLDTYLTLALVMTL